MKVIDHNPDRTIGIVESAENLEHIGGYAPEIFSEFVETINTVFDIKKSGTIHLFVKKSKDVDSHAIFASYEGSDPLVVMSGKIPADNKPWGNVYGGKK